MAVVPGLRRSLGARCFRGLGVFVDGLAQLHGNLGQGFSLGLDVFDIVAVHGFLEGGDGGFDGGLVILGNLVAVFLQVLFDAVNKAVRLIARLDGFLAVFIFLGVLFGFLDHAVDIVVVEAAGGFDADLLFLAGRLVLGRNMHDAVGVDVEGDLDLRHAAHGRRNADQVELAENLIVRGHLAFTLENPDGHRRLVVLRGGENLALAGRDGGVAVDEARKDAAQRFDAERQRRHIQQQDVLDVALQHAALDSGAESHHFIRVDPLMGLAAEEFLHRFKNLGHAGHAADQDDLVDFTGAEAGVLKGRFAGRHRALHQVFDQGFQFGAGQLDIEVLRPVLVSGNKGQVDFRLHGAGQFNLGLFRFFLEALQGQLVLAQVDGILFFEFVGQVIDDADVEVLAAQEGVAVGRFHLENAVADFQDGNIEGAAAQVIYGDGAGLIFLEPVGESGRRRFVNDAQHFQAGDLAGILGGLALGIVEIGRNRDHRLGDALAQVAFRRFLHLLQDKGADLAGTVFLVVAFDPGITVVTLDNFVGDKAHVLLGERVVKAPSDQALDGEQRIFRVGHRLAFGRLSDQPLTGIGEGDH